MSEVDLKKVAIGDGFDTTSVIRALAKAVTDLQDGDKGTDSAVSSSRELPSETFTADSSLNSLLGMSIANLLYSAGYSTEEDIVNASDSELIAIDGVGRATLRSIREALSK